MRAARSAAVQMGEGCCSCFGSGNATWSNRQQRRQNKRLCCEGERSGHEMGNYEQQYGEEEVFETVLPNGSTLHICIQFSM